MEVGNRQIELVLLEKNQKKKKRDEKGLLSVLVRCSASAIEAGPVLFVGVGDGRASLGRKGRWAIAGGLQRFFAVVLAVPGVAAPARRLSIDG